MICAGSGINKGADALMKLAASAAVSLDAIHLGRTEVELACLEQLNRMLKEFGETPIHDTQILLALWRALEASTRQRYVKVSHVVHGVRTVQSELREFVAQYKRQGRRSGAAQLRAFCVNLSRAAEAYRVSR